MHRRSPYRYKIVIKTLLAVKTITRAKSNNGLLAHNSTKKLLFAVSGSSSAEEGCSDNNGNPFTLENGVAPGWNSLL